MELGFDEAWSLGGKKSGQVSKYNQGSSGSEFRGARLPLLALFCSDGVLKRHPCIFASLDFAICVSERIDKPSSSCYVKLVHANNNSITYGNTTGLGKMEVCKRH